MRREPVAEEVSLLDGPFALERVHREIVLLQANQNGVEQLDMFLSCKPDGLSVSPRADVVDVAITVLDITKNLLHLGLRKGWRILDTHWGTAVAISAKWRDNSSRVLDLVI